MAYTLNSAKDSQGNEHEFVRNFQERMPEILAYKREHGGDLEGAYGAVTGVPWPAGRSVKLKDGQPEMTKDRTVKSVLGKYVAAPAAIGLTAAFAPGALPAVGKAMLGGSKLASIAGVTKAAGLARTGINLARNPSVGGLISAGTDIASANAAPGSRMAGITDMIAPAGAAIRGATQQAAENRAAQQSASVSGVGVDREALRNMGTASYIAGSGQRDPFDPFAGLGTFAGRYTPPTARGTRKQSPAEMAFAKAMQDELLKRQAAGESLTTSGIQDPGTMERIGEYAGPGMAILDAFLQSRSRRTPAAAPEAADSSFLAPSRGTSRPFSNIQF